MTPCSLKSCWPAGRTRREGPTPRSEAPAGPGAPPGDPAPTARRPPLRATGGARLTFVSLTFGSLRAKGNVAEQQVIRGRKGKEKTRYSRAGGRNKGAGLGVGVRNGGGGEGWKTGGGGKR